MNRSTTMARLAKLEAASRSTGKLHVLFVTRNDEDEAAAKRESERRQAAMIESGEAGPDDEFVILLTYYEREPDGRQKPLVPSPEPETIAPLAQTSRADLARQLADLEERYEAQRAPSVAVPEPEHRDTPHGQNRRPALDLRGASLPHPPVGH